MLRKYVNTFDLDDPQATIYHSEILEKKLFLKKIYLHWYKVFDFWIKKNPDGIHLELGSGGGFLKSINPNVITSDILKLPNVDMVINAESINFDNNSISTLMLLNVFHHIPRPYLFLNEAKRCMKTGGIIVMIEPANTFFSRIIYKKFHHEPFDENGPREIEEGKPLSNSNQALPFIYFKRDLDLFKNEFPELKVVQYINHTPLLYILSGGFSRPSLVHSKSFELFKFSEKLLFPLNFLIGMFSTIVIQKK